MQKTSRECTEEMILELNKISNAIDQIQNIGRGTKEYWMGETGELFREIMQIEIKEGRTAEKRLLFYAKKIGKICKTEQDLPDLPIDIFE